MLNKDKETIENIINVMNSLDLEHGVNIAKIVISGPNSIEALNMFHELMNGLQELKNQGSIDDNTKNIIYQEAVNTISSLHDKYAAN